ncbi:MAG: aldehyde dehydrogenase family protein [Chloroflexi bacterium]|nr:aldehyde dehydrogenase family protein [Chloroflexota bacterium]
MTVTAAQTYFSVSNPATGEPIGSLPLMGRDDVQAAVSRARAAQPGWEALGVHDRARLLRLWADAVLADQRHLMGLIRRETGKSDPSAFVEVLVLDNIASYYAKHAPRILKAQRRMPVFPLVHRAHVHYRPYGVAGFITPWNYPYFNGLSDLLPALVAGNSVVLKPSEITPYVALYAVEKMREVGFPPDVIQVVTGDGSTGAALIDCVDYIHLTGSTATGRKVALRAAERLIPYSLELGGKDPLIVLNDADLDSAVVGTLRSALENAGQACISIERVYVEQGIYEAFLERALTYVQQYTVGAEGGNATCMGCMTNERELLRTEDHLRDAVAKGARILYGGKRRPDLGPLFFEPTLLVDVDHTMHVMTDETFGPLVPIMRVRDADEAIRLANDTSYGLSASLYTRDLRRGEQLARRIEAGDVSINRPQMVIGTPSLPMGGVKASGVGRRGGPEGLLRFVQTQSILADTLLDVRLGMKPSLTFTDPVTSNGFKVMRALRRLVPFL